MNFEWLPDAFRQLRGVDPMEVHEALGSARRWPRAAQDDIIGLKVLTIWARTGTGRPLVIAVRHRTGWEWQCVGARVMTAKELEQFESWEGTQ